ncbi:hypothetical protein Gotri_014626 [Gossypium trilobum]|uniref:Uncharacterized protein n=1 Tax=Gossypium trilobum TaxID=34281 RepID=A0A7J9DXC3_9ROSI|nr:hypothetical protein [Gossypium trilobum]
MFLFAVVGLDLLQQYVSMTCYLHLIKQENHLLTEFFMLGNVQILLNPLYLPGSRITSSHFDTKVRALARKYL